MWGWSSTDPILLPVLHSCGELRMGTPIATPSWAPEHLLVVMGWDLGGFGSKTSACSGGMGSGWFWLALGGTSQALLIPESGSILLGLEAEPSSFCCPCPGPSTLAGVKWSPRLPSFPQPINLYHLPTAGVRLDLSWFKSGV